MLLIDGLSYGYASVSVLRWLPSLLLLLPWLLGPLAPSNEARIRQLAGPTSFGLLDWETVHLGERAGRLWTGLVGDVDVRPTDGDTLRAYFSAQSTTALAEAALEREVARAYRDAGLTRSEPVPLGNRLFPPLLVALTQPPNVLVIAPRAELRVISSAVLQPMTVPDQERLERSADSTGVSSLIAPIGGLATYPSMVLEERSAERVVTSVAHEWLHQYLIFYPLGTGYWNSQETREINETTADMIGQEVGAAIATRLGYSPPVRVNTAPGAAQPPPFDFRAFMRATRVHTENLLASGQVEAAELYMRQRRDELAEQHGIQIRKLNQAYFALYGSYGDGFAASPSNPIPNLLRTLRAQSSSIGEFIIQVRSITTVAQLQAVAQK
jgi:hypothetical protein